MKNILMVLSMFLFLTSCGVPKVDATNDETMKVSVAEVRESLPESKRGKFDEAMKVMVFSQIDLRSLMADGASGAENIKTKVRQSIHGKTGLEIIAAAAKIKQEREHKEKEKALNEIKELERKKVETENARKELNKFEILNARFYKKKQRFGSDQPIIEINVKNGTPHAISRAYFKGIIASPERSVPWHQDTFNYSIPGGLEPGEKAKWTLAPNMFSDWGRAESPKGSVFTVTVEKLDDAKGETLYSTRDFGEKDKARLAELKEKYKVQ